MTDALTNEKLKGICNSNFQLVHQMIRLGRYYIHSGREASLSAIIGEVKKHPNANYVDELLEIDAIEEKSKELQRENGQ